MKAFVRETRYIVLKVSDLASVDTNITSNQHKVLSQICEQVRAARIIQGKPTFQCVVVESDWPEYEPTWKAIEERMKGLT